MHRDIEPVSPASPTVQNNRPAIRGPIKKRKRGADREVGLVPSVTLCLCGEAFFELELA